MAGIEVLLDIDDMEGDVNAYMSKGIQDSCRVLLVLVNQSLLND